MELNERLEVNEVVLSKMNTLARKEFVNKLKVVHERNVGYETIRKIRDVLYESRTSDNEYIQKLSSAEKRAIFKYSPTTSMDVERSFSVFKLVFSERRKSFSFENLKKHVLVKCNRSLVPEEEQ